MSYAYIFDFDGVLVRTMAAHFRCYKQALEEFGVSIDKKQFYSQAGMTGVEQIECFARQAGVTVDPRAVYERKREIWNGSEPEAERIECNLAMFGLLKKAGVPVAIATGSSRPTIGPIMRMHGIQPDAVVTSEDVERGKPFPDLFLSAADLLGVPPARCIVVEDSDVGIEAAAAAGMKAMRFYDNEIVEE